MKAGNNVNFCLMLKHYSNKEEEFSILLMYQLLIIWSFWFYHIC